MTINTNLYAVEGKISLKIDEVNNTVIVRNEYTVIVCAKNEDEAMEKAFEQFKDNTIACGNNNMEIQLKVFSVQDITPRLVVVKEPVNS